MARLGWVRLAAILIAATVAAVCSAGVAYLMNSTEKASAPSGVGGPFRLVTQDGRMLSDSDLKGHPFAIFFGFTHCPEICPTTLAELSSALDELGPSAKDFRVLFVSLDPARDDPAALKSYLQSFDPRIVGLTGPQEDIAAVAKAYRVYWRTVPGSDGDYTLDHTAITYLMDRSGRYAGIIGYAEPHGEVVKRLRQLVEGGVS